MKKLKKQDQAELESAITSAFPGFTSTIADESMQGQNGHSCNYKLQKDGKDFLLKILFIKELSDIDLDQANTEADICATVKSPSTVSLLNRVTTDKFIFLLFPLLTGETLDSMMTSRFLSGGTFSETEIRDIGIGILNAVSEIYRKNKIVHQDIKPGNIFITDSHEIRLLDFGAARYKRSPFKGPTRHNFKYSSPEQILSSPPFTLEDGRQVIDDRSDVYSVGLILYEMATSQHPYTDDKYPAVSIASGNPVPQMKTAGLSKEIREIISALLSFSSENRPHATMASASLQEGKLIIPQFDKGKFYYCATNGLSRFAELNDSDKKVFDGVVVEAPQVPPSKANLAALRIASPTFIVDPQAYLFQKPLHIKEKFKKLPYYSLGKEGISGDGFSVFINTQPDKRRAFVEQVINHQIDCGASAIVPPFLYIDDFNGVSWTADQALMEDSTAVLNESAIPLPIIKGIALQQGVLTSSSKDGLLRYLTSLENVSGFLVLLDSGHGEVVTEEPWLINAKDLFIRLLATGKSVIWSRADISGLVIGHPSLSLAMGEGLSSRKFNIDNAPARGGRQTPQIYLPGIFARAKWPEAMKALKDYSKYQELICPDSCCASSDFDSLGTRDIRDLALHMLCQFRNQYKKYSSLNGSVEAKKDIKAATVHYKELARASELIKQALRKGDIKPQNGAFLENWLNALHSR